MRRVFRVVRDGWLIIGITLVMLVALEYAYRLQSAIRKSKPTGPVLDSTQHPYAGQEWFRVFVGPRGVQALKYRYDPYRGYLLRPLQTPYINIDSSGARLTIEVPSESAKPRRVFMLGGSSLWGYASRDSFTIASFLSLNLAARGVKDVQVVSLAEPGYNSTQELATLVLHLSRGDVPDIAVFFDGYNDISTTLRYGEPGHMYEEEIAQQRLDLGKRGFWAELFGLGRHSRLVQRLGASRQNRVHRSATLDVGHACEAMGAYYRNIVRSAEALGREYGFTPVFFFQPYHSTTGKPLTAWEKGFPREEAYIRCTLMVDSLLADRLGRDYYSLHALFDGDTSTVFVDKNSHITEAANAMVADRMAEVVGALLPVAR